MSGAGLDRRLAALAEAARARPRAAGRRRRSSAPDAVVAGRASGSGSAWRRRSSRSAGPTGAGKSSLFNALAGAELAPAGHRRPTTSATTAAVWGDVGDRAARLARRDAAPPRGADGPPTGWCSWTCPTSTRSRRRTAMEVERVVALADLMVWVVDPQKYADAACCTSATCARSPPTATTMLVVLNQADRLDAARGGGLRGRSRPAARRGRPAGRPGARRLRAHRRGPRRAAGGAASARRRARERGRAARGRRRARRRRAGRGAAARKPGRIGKPERARARRGAGRAPPACRRSCAPSRAATGARCARRRAGRSSAGCGGSRPTRCGGCAWRRRAAAELDPGGPARSSLPAADARAAGRGRDRRAGARRPRGRRAAPPWPGLVRRAALVARGRRCRGPWTPPSPARSCACARRAGGASRARCSSCSPLAAVAGALWLLALGGPGLPPARRRRAHAGGGGDPGADRPARRRGARGSAAQPAGGLRRARRRAAPRAEGGARRCRAASRRSASARSWRRSRRSSPRSGASARPWRLQGAPRSAVAYS